MKPHPVQASGLGDVDTPAGHALQVTRAAVQVKMLVGALTRIWRQRVLLRPGSLLPAPNLRDFLS